HPHRLGPLRVRLFWRLFHPTASQRRDDSVVLDGRIVSEFRTLPRLLVAGMPGGSRKTLVALGLLLSLRRAGVPVRAFKKGPDYIDAAWLSWASGQPARNLDTNLMGAGTILSSFVDHGVVDGINVIEGARGLYDGFDVDGSHSSAVLSKHLRTPVVIVVNAAKVTRTAAAQRPGCQRRHPEVPLQSVTPNNVNGRRPEQIQRASIESVGTIPAPTAIPKAAAGDPLS